MPLPPRPDRPKGHQTNRALAWLAGAAILSGCASGSAERGRTGMPAPQRPVEVLPLDPLSPELAAYYGQIEAQRLARGWMRTDSGAQESATGASRLAQTYIDVALREEHARGPAGFAGTRTSVLRRWAVPVRYRLEFGATVGRATRLRDQAQVAALAARLSAAARHPISLQPSDATEGNFHILVLSENERRNIGPRLRQLIPGIDDGAVRLIEEMPRETFCLVMAFARDGSANTSEAVAIIRAEHPDLTRLACYHEELTQGLGLANDSDAARPSIFNDDQEFALITDHDLLLLRMHYDPRLTPGLPESALRPTIFSIASELAAGES